MKHWMTLVGLLLIFQPGLPARATTHNDLFYIALEGNELNWNMIDESRSGGSGWTEAIHPSAWFRYGMPAGTEQKDGWGKLNPQPAWLNQWYYDDPYDPTRYKVVTVNFTYALNTPGSAGGANIVINYSLPGWSPNPLAPPTPQDDNPPGTYIGRVQIASLWLEAADAGLHTYSKTFDLRDYGINYNPEWVSIDIAGYNVLLSNQANPGSFKHECLGVPLPAALPGGSLLLCLAGASRLLYRRLRCPT